MIVKRVYIARFVNNISLMTHTKITKKNNIVTHKYNTHQQIHAKRYNVTKNSTFFVNKIIPANYVKSTNTIPSKRFKAIKHNINMIQSDTNTHCV